MSSPLYALRSSTWKPTASWAPSHVNKTLASGPSSRTSPQLIWGSSFFLPIA